MKDFVNAFTRDELIDLLDDTETPRVSTGTVRELIRSLIAEMDKPGVWDGAPYWVNAARVRFFVNDRNDGHSEVFSETYTRELPKSRAREIAEECVHEHINKETFDRSLADIIESAILKALAEKEAGRC